MSTKCEELELLSNIGKPVKFSEKGNPKIASIVGQLIDEVSLFVSYPNDECYKFFIQKIIDGNNGIAFRFCYYTLNKNKNKIVFGQFASQLSAQEFKDLMGKGRAKGFI